MTNIPLSTIQTAHSQWRKAHGQYDHDSNELHVLNTRGQVLTTIRLTDTLTFEERNTGRWWTANGVTIKETPGCGCGGTQEWLLAQLDESEWI